MHLKPSGDHELRYFIVDIFMNYIKYGEPSRNNISGDIIISFPLKG